MNIKKVNEKIYDNFYISRKGYYYHIKRVFDIFFSLIAIVFLIPLLIAVAIFIKFDSEGEVLFTQNRVGIDGKIFKMYKFRSMFNDAELRLDKLKHLNEIDGLMFKMKEDPRVTNIGRIIRAYSIDELPQLLNVIKGDMSLIGPRPPLIREFKEYTDYDKQRLYITPGITGLWQVSGRNSLTFSEMVEIDIEYIKTLSMKKDIIIFLKTIIVVLKKENAY